MAINLSIEYPRLEAENQKLKRLLHDLTPGGSEFYNDPEYCAKWIKEDGAKLTVAYKEKIKEAKLLREALNQISGECLKVLEIEAGVRNEKWEIDYKSFVGAISETATKALNK